MLTTLQYVESSSNPSDIPKREHVSQFKSPLTVPIQQIGYQSSRHRARRNSCPTLPAGSAC
jgi:hypothetical protein